MYAGWSSFFFFLNLLHMNVVLAQLSLYNLSTVIGLNSACIQALNQPVACSPALAQLTWQGRLSRFQTDAYLTGLCTVSCSNSLQTWQHQVDTSCGTQRFSKNDEYLYLAQYLTETYIEAFNTTCLKNPYVVLQ